MFKAQRLKCTMSVNSPGYHETITVKAKPSPNLKPALLPSSEGIWPPSHGLAILVTDRLSQVQGSSYARGLRRPPTWLRGSDRSRGALGLAGSRLRGSDSVPG